MRVAILLMALSAAVATPVQDALVTCMNDRLTRAYSESAYADNVTGEVWIRLPVDTGVKGIGVIAATACESLSEDLDNAILDALKDCRPEPKFGILSVRVSAGESPRVSRVDLWNVEGDVKAPVETYRIEAQYTEIAKAVRKEGIVIVQAVIDHDGRVRCATVLKGLGFGLDEKALEAVSQWRFKPATSKDEPVPVYLTTVVRFQITS